jgi:oxygen-dependent protoporphyrinogen oxidase
MSLAHALLRRGARERGLELVVLEKAQHPGGNLRSESVGGYLCEAGPNGFLDNAPRTLELVRELGLEGRLLPSNASARKRYVYRDERLHLVPADPLGFLTSRLLSWRGKWAVAREPFAARRPDGDETIHEFAARRIGPEAAEVLVGAMVSGVFAGDARALSLRACFPRLWQMETGHGGLLRAVLAGIGSRRRRRAEGDPSGAPTGRLTSFVGGIEELIHGLARSLGKSLQTSAALVGIEATDGGYALKLEAGGIVRADAVVLACPPRESARLVATMDSALAAELGGVHGAPLSVVALGYVRDQIPPLDGFGFLVARRQGPRALGALWDSSIFAKRAPEGRALVRVMIGGGLDPGAAELSDNELVTTARQDLATAMLLTAQPELVRVTRHPAGIPQYEVGHLERLARIDARLARHPGLFVAGNGYRGVSINSCVAEAHALAERLLLLASAPRAAPDLVSAAR